MELADRLDNIDTMQGMCFRKKQLSYNLAKRLAKEWNQRPYECPICQRWHLTKQSESDFVNTLYKETSKITIRPKEGLTATFFTNKVLWSNIPINTLFDIAAILNIQQPNNPTIQDIKAVMRKCNLYPWKIASEQIKESVFCLLKTANNCMKE